MTANATAADYPLYFRDGDGLFLLSLATHGLRLDDEGVTFENERETRTIRFPEIHSIRLQTSFANKGTPLGLCTIKFGRWRKLTVYSGDAYLRADEAQGAAYIRFVHDLHRRIPAADRSRIGFNGGLSEGRHMIVSIAALVGAAIFVVLPLVLIVIVPRWETLSAAVASFGLAYVGWKNWSRNRPQTYSPDRVPEELLP
jgi:hypothetical protein